MNDYCDIRKPQIIVTNNPMVAKEYERNYKVDYLGEDTYLLEVMLKAADYIRAGHRLITHPLAGSLKPNEIKYKSILISGGNINAERDVSRSMELINSCMLKVTDFPVIDIPEEHWKELQLIDYILVTQ